MSGAPQKAKIVAALEKHALAELGEDATIADYAEDWISSGRTIADLARVIGAELEMPVSRQVMSSIVNRAAPDARERLTAARTEGATAMVEESIRIADDAEETTAGVAKAGLQARTRQWVAEHWDAATYGTKGGATVNVNIGALLLDAFRQPIPPRPERAAIEAPASPAFTDYEVLESAPVTSGAD